MHLLTFFASQNTFVTKQVQELTLSYNFTIKKSVGWHFDEWSAASGFW